MIISRLDKQKGFTLIELLVVVAIIGLLSSLIAVGFGNARLRSRDAKRLSDMNQVKSGMDLFYTSAGGYPDATIWNAGAVACSGQRYMEVPRDLSTGLYYTYTTDDQNSDACGAPLWRNYQVQFSTEGRTELGDAGIYYFSPRGFTPAPIF